jgi:hypothetical protein
MPRKTPQKGAFRGLAKPHFNHFRLQTAPPLAKPYFRQMLLNGIAVKLAFSSYKYDKDPTFMRCPCRQPEARHDQRSQRLTSTNRH